MHVSVTQADVRVALNIVNLKAGAGVVGGVGTKTVQTANQKHVRCVL